MRTMDSDQSSKFGGSRHGSVVTHMSNVVGTLVSRQSGKGSSEKGSSEGGRKEGSQGLSRPGSSHGPPRAPADIVEEIKGKMAPRSSGGNSGGSNSLSAKESFVTRSPAVSKVLVASFTESEVVRDIAPSGTLPSRPVSTLESSTHDAAAAAGGGAVAV